MKNEPKRKITLDLDYTDYMILCDALAEFRRSRVGYSQPGTPGFKEAVEAYVNRRYPTFNEGWRNKKCVEVENRLSRSEDLYEAVVHCWHEPKD